MIHESGENYLEKILTLSRGMERVRAVDLSAAFGFSRPTVSVMLRELRKSGFVTVGEGGSLSLTPAGLAVAERVYARHCTISELLISLGVPREVALEDACKMEHDISDVTFECIKTFCAKRREGGNA